MFVNKGETVKLVCNPSTGDDIKDMIAWMQTCSVSGDATFYLEIADGNHDVNTYIDIVGVGTEIDIRATAAPSFNTITGYSSTLVSGTQYRITATLGSALDSNAEVGKVIGIQNAQGNDDEEALNGAHIVQSIAGDRLSFTFDVRSTNGAFSHGTLDNTLTNGLLANQVLVYKATLHANSSGWDGSAREGFINLLFGGRMTWRNLGLSYNGTANTEHDLVFCKGSGSRFYGYDFSAFCGAGDKVFRGFGECEILLNRCQIGGGIKAQELYQGTSGGNAQFVRCSFGSANLSGFTVGNAAECIVSQCQGGAVGECFRVVSLDGFISAYPVRIKHCVTAVEVFYGFFQGSSTTVLSNNGTGLVYRNGAVLAGDIQLVNNVTNVNGFANGVSAANVSHRGGIWYDGTL